MPGWRKSKRLALSPCAKPSPPLRTGDTKFSPSSSFCPRVFPMGLWKARTTAPKPLCARGMAIAIATICVYVFYWGMSHELFANFPRKDGEPKVLVPPQTRIIRRRHTINQGLASSSCRGGGCEEKGGDACVAHCWAIFLTPDL